jgi:hypothetical protein
MTGEPVEHDHEHIDPHPGEVLEIADAESAAAYPGEDEGGKP